MSWKHCAYLDTGDNNCWVQMPDCESMTRYLLVWTMVLQNRAQHGMGEDHGVQETPFYLRLGPGLHLWPHISHSLEDPLPGPSLCPEWNLKPLLDPSHPLGLICYPISSPLMKLYADFLFASPSLSLFSPHGLCTCSFLFLECPSPNI